jgi:alginate O-acetyltransferase complex protein AlgJ
VPRAISPGNAAFPEHVDRWAQALSARRAWLADRGIKYLVVAAPDKQSIYPEYVPEFARRHGPSAFDELLTRCARDPDLTVLDLRPALRSARPAGLLYWRTDTHWCGAGPYVAYAATATALGRWYPSSPPLPPTAFSVRPLFGDGGDLARLIGMAGRMPEGACRLVPTAPAHARPSAVLPAYQRDPVLAHVPPAAWDNDTPGLPRVLLLSDSFADDCFCTSLAEHCGRLVRVGSYVGQEDLIERERPDVVIFEFVERIVECYSLHPPPAGERPSLQHPNLVRVGK